MLFLVKRTWLGGLAGLVVLAALGLGLREGFDIGPPVHLSGNTALLGLGVFAAVLASDGLLHGLFLLVIGEPYRRRHRELVQVFQGQTIAAVLAGAAMAGLGEEWIFRGLSTRPVYLVCAAVGFGLLHHIRWSLWPFTVWAIYQGLLFAAALAFTGSLAVTMVAHFLHDLAGFLIFRYLNHRHKIAD